jgi:dTDP-4-dehydrorhamnose reductase
VRVLVLGATGMLGRDLCEVLTASNHAVTAYGSKDLDLTSERAILDCLALSKKQHDWVINCAAYTAVDQAESEPEKAWDLNEEAVLNLAMKLENGPRLLHISTDFVFDGTKRTPYAEEDETNPLGTYGQTKLGGEHYAEAMLEDAIIFRTSWLYGPHGKSFPRTMVQLHRAGKQLRVVSDQIGCPTYTVDLASAIAQAITQNLAGGVYHAAGKDAMTWHAFAEKIISLDKKKPVSLEAIPTSEYPTPAKRPQYSVLSTAKLANERISPWRDTETCLRDFLERLEI